MSRQELRAIRREVACRVRDWRESEGISQEELARRLGIHRVSVTHLEAGTHGINVERLYAIAEALDLPVFKLLPTPAWERSKEGEHAAD